ncbi:hypothetical protein HYFRA_00009639 [Hymenoscyphus fraxineus]|uniref:Uncharacterized protein n=1 Tax=Hymenoscyphus fraxineus TaxID=746836 RepID=A0A9N9PQW8_9HELO|nr:hypothetical protein HYFRA_00009639 [Hymenoscyphus fraxineus]
MQFNHFLTGIFLLSSALHITALPVQNIENAGLAESHHFLGARGGGKGLSDGFERATIQSAKLMTRKMSKIQAQEQRKKYRRLPVSTMPSGPKAPSNQKIGRRSRLETRQKRGLTPTTSFEGMKAKFVKTNSGRKVEAEEAHRGSGSKAQETKSSVQGAGTEFSFPKVSKWGPEGPPTPKKFGQPLGRRSRLETRQTKGFMASFKEMKAKYTKARQERKAKAAEMKFKKTVQKSGVEFAFPQYFKYGPGGKAVHTEKAGH